MSPSLLIIPDVILQGHQGTASHRDLTACSPRKSRDGPNLRAINEPGAEPGAELAESGGFFDPQPPRLPPTATSFVRTARSVCGVCEQESIEQKSVASLN